MVVDSVSVIVSVKNLYNVNNNMRELSRVHCRVYRNTTDRLCI